MYEFSPKVIAFFSENMSIMDLIECFLPTRHQEKKKQVHESHSDPILVNCNQKTFSSFLKESRFLKFWEQ